MSWQDIQAEELDALLQSGELLVIDQRDERTRSHGQLPHAQVVSEQLIQRLVRLRSKAPPVLVYCYHGNQSRELCEFLAQFGLPEVYNLAGGWQALEQFSNSRNQATEDV
ncbi:MAG: hypothetical protein KZQ58_10835 [gamma proteobacterium symbiont of Bathyaustriella thionipta]|nr:hypothetical protein [gamma proteobacterium symbiont of Bathyaustriella thionipta]